MLYAWDPRPEECRGVNKTNVNSFVTSLQSDSKLTMWETVLQLKYDDFSLDNEDVILYQSQVREFEKKMFDYNMTLLTSKDCSEIPDTSGQAESKKWHTERLYRITASICKYTATLGEHLGLNDSLRPHFNWIKRHFWFPEKIVTIHMKYGIENEGKAIKQYTEIKQVEVTPSGLWINASFVHLAASPDGLIFDESKNFVGIVEVKCLNILRLNSVDDILQNNCPDAPVKRQCFNVCGDQLVLKKSHMYYYQVQLQLLVTKAKYCDFVLFSSKGPPSIQRIYSDTELQNRIAHNTKLFWSKVFIPEYFLMRVPRGLLPIVL